MFRPLVAIWALALAAVALSPCQGQGLPAGLPASTPTTPTGPAEAQTPGASAAPRYGSNNAAEAAPSPANEGAPASGTRVTRAQVTKGSGALPSEHGQVWREYDISPYTVRLQSSSRPEQALVDWILRETGYEAWHATPLGVLSADRRTLRVYHTPPMQAVVGEIVDRFVNTQAENHGFGLRIITLKNPNWRARALPLMTSIPVQSAGVQGWILAREDAALLLSELRRRTDYREHNPPHKMVLNGQSIVVSSMRQRQYAKGVIRTQNVWPGYQPELGQIDEGFSLEFNPLLSLDTRSTDAVVKLQMSQVEKMLPVQLDAPSSVAPNQQTQVEVPQLTMVQLHERFRWPTDQVLLLSMGVVATPAPEKSNALTTALPLFKSAPRADALLMVESRGPVAPQQGAFTDSIQTAGQQPATFHGRY